MVCKINIYEQFKISILNEYIFKNTMVEGEGYSYWWITISSVGKGSR